MKAPFLSNIRIYPIKSLDPIDLEAVHIWKYSLLHDREFAMVAEDGKFINSKRTGKVNTLKAEYDLENQLVILSKRGEVEKHTFQLSEDNEELTQYLSDFFEMRVKLVRSTRGELMDIPQKSSITILSEGSLQSLDKDLNTGSIEDLRLRFRSNLEISGVAAYWEDQLFDKPGIGIHFKIGDVELVGISPRARCNVPPRDPLSGETNKEFVKLMMASRSSALSEQSLLPLHGNYYHLAVDLFLLENQEGKVLKTGDELTIIGKVQIQ